MNLEMGPGPSIDGRYVCYVTGHFGWLEPHVLTWAKGEWHYLNTSKIYGQPVHCWMGPLPVMSENYFYDTIAPQMKAGIAGYALEIADPATPATEYDL